MSEEELKCALEVKKCGCMVTAEGTIYCQRHEEERKLEEDESKIGIGSRVNVTIDGKEIGGATVKRFSHIPKLVLINLDNGGWMLVHKASLSLKAKKGCGG